METKTKKKEKEKNKIIYLIIYLKIDSSNAPYVVTKPFHHSQEILQRHNDGSITLKLSVHVNFELERLILGFGDSLEVLKPSLLRKRIVKKLERSIAKYTQQTSS